MAGKKKFGAFTGVFTPSILTILGVIMYMRLGWVVGNAGLVGTIMIVLLAHVIAVTTGLSISSVATDKKIGAGGIYYILSRSMGIPIGGSIGIALYVGTAFSIALYLIGFAESFNGYFGFGTDINDLRITGTLALMAITALALVSTSVALKAQFFILAAIIISLVSIFFGTAEFAPKTVSLFASEGAVPLEIVFAIFFPAVTGFTAGIAMSGDLKDPKKSIPFGTLAAIGTGLVVYLMLAFYLANTVNTDLLLEDHNILMKIALFAPAVVAGIWGATLSSALGGILGGPRILQAMSLDKVTPKIFGRGRGKNNEPVNALILVFAIAQAGVLIGELDVIARVVSMFYLTAYGFINLSYFLESWANPDFQPSFKIKRWIGLLGFVASFGVMFKLDMLAMFGAFAVVGGLYLWLQRKQLRLQSNDVWQSVWSNLVNKGLRRLEATEESHSNWIPNILLFGGDSPHRSKLLELCNCLSGRTGVVTDFELVTGGNGKPTSKNKQAFKNELLEKFGAYGRKVEVDDSYSGIENIASTYGFSGIEPNTVMMSWSKTTRDLEKHAKMTQKLIHLDYNLLYLDYDERTKFGNYQTIDLWWRETDSSNAEMMLNICRFITQSPEWSKAKIRILFVNHNNTDHPLIRSNIANLVDKLRIDAEIKIINNGVEQKSFYKIIELQSSKTDLIVLGIPNIKVEKQAEYILKTDHLFETVGSTLLVKASDKFNDLDLDLVQTEVPAFDTIQSLPPIISTEHAKINEVIFALDKHFSDTTEKLTEPALATLSSSYYTFIKDIQLQFEKSMQPLGQSHSTIKVVREVQVFLNNSISSSDDFITHKLPEVEQLFKLGIESYLKERKEFVLKSLRIVKYVPGKKWLFGLINNTKKIDWRNLVEYYYKTTIAPNTERSLYAMGVQSFVLLNMLAEGIKEKSSLFIEKIGTSEKDWEVTFREFSSDVNGLFDDLLNKCLALETRTAGDLSSCERDVCIELANNIEDPGFNKQVQKERENLKESNATQTFANISAYASDWRRNQQLAHNQLKADLILCKAGLSTFKVNEMIKSRLNRLAIAPQKKKIKLFTDALNQLNEHIAEGKLKGYTDKGINILATDIPHVDFSEILRKEEDRILSISGSAPEQVNVINANSFNHLQSCQNDELEEIEVSFANIQNYNIQSSYLSPLQDSLYELEGVIKENAEVLYNASNLVKNILDEQLEADNITDHRDDLKEVQNNIKNCSAELKKIEASFNYGLNVHLRNTLTGLNIRSIIESIDSYSSISHTPILKTNFQKWFDEQRGLLLRKYKGFYGFIVQRKRDVDRIKFREKHTQYLNSIELTNEFVKELGFNHGVEDELSFYYKKLFTGSHLGNINPTYNPKALTAAKNTINRIDRDISGGIMILGESVSGKTFYIESISNTLIDGEKIYLTPPAKQKYDESDIDTAFQSAFSSKRSTSEILNQLERNKTLIFDDLEKWWVKAPNGEVAINYLSNIIGKYGSKHHFLISCNIFSYDIIRKISSLDKNLLATIIVPPVSRTELKEILLHRHRTAGAEIWYKNHLVGDTKKSDGFFNDLYSKSSGNTGVALVAWVRSINKDKKGQLTIAKTDAVQFPRIENPYWKILLYHLAIHGNLKEEQIKRIFNEPEWIYSTLSELEKASLVYKQSNTVYAINYAARFYVEKWFRELKILN